MNKFYLRFFACIRRASLAGLLASALVGFSASASAESWEGFKSKYEYDQAVHYLNSGYSQIGRVAYELDEGNSKSAMKHYNHALKDFDKAVGYYADAELPPEDDAAVDALKKGLASLEKSTKAIEKGDLATAQTAYETAQNYLAAASILLD